MINSRVHIILVGVSVDDSVNRHNDRIVSLYCSISSCSMWSKEDGMSNQHLLILRLVYNMVYYDICD